MRRLLLRKFKAHKLNDNTIKKLYNPKESLRFNHLAKEMPILSILYHTVKELVLPLNLSQFYSLPQITPPLYSTRCGYNITGVSRRHYTDIYSKIDRASEPRIQHA